MRACGRYLAVLAGLFLSIATPAAPQPASMPVQLSSEDNGKALQLKMGQTLSISLPARPGTGYNWMVEACTGLRPVHSAFAGKGLPGGRQSQLLRFRADAAGPGSLVLVYRRPWEKPDAAGDRFSITFTAGEN